MVGTRLVCIGFPGGSEGAVPHEADRVALRGDADCRLILVLYLQLPYATELGEVRAVGCTGLPRSAGTAYEE